MPGRKEPLILALALLLVAAAPFDARAGCTPTAAVGSTVTEDTASSDTEVHCDRDEDAWSPNDAFNDHGYGREMSTARDTTHVNANVYVWAEDGDSSYIDFTARVARAHTLMTICEPALSHAVPPYGSNRHTIRSDVHIMYNAGATGGDAQRSGSATMLARMPTGRSVKIDWHTDDQAEKDNFRSLRYTVDAEGNLSEAVEVEGGAQSPIAGRLRTMAGGSIEGIVVVVHLSKWVGNRTVSASDVIDVSDTSTLITECHGEKVQEVESSSLSGSMDLGPTPDSSSVYFMHGDFEVHQIVSVVSSVESLCGDEVLVPPPEEPGTPTGPGTGGETTPSEEPADPDGGTATEDPAPTDDGASATGGGGTAVPDPDGGDATTDGADAGALTPPDPNEPAPDDPPELPDGWGLAGRTRGSEGRLGAYRLTV